MGLSASASPPPAPLFTGMAVLAARPTAKYDEQFGREPGWTAKDLVPIIYYEAGGGPSVP